MVKSSGDVGHLEISLPYLNVELFFLFGAGILYRLKNMKRQVFSLKNNLENIVKPWLCKNTLQSLFKKQQI